MQYGMCTIMQFTLYKVEITEHIYMYIIKGIHICIYIGLYWVCMSVSKVWYNSHFGAHFFRKFAFDSLLGCLFFAEVD